jgi:hypothetical protein
MPAEFRHVWKDIGASDFSAIPRPIIVPVHQYTLIVLRGASRWTAGPNLHVMRIEEQELMDVLNDLLLTQLEIDGVNLNALYADLWTLLKKSFAAGDSLLQVRGRLPGRSWIIAGDVKQELLLTVGESYDLSFLFLKHQDEDGQPVPATQQQPADVTDWISELNWILGAQVNIWFETYNKDWIPVNVHLKGVGDAFYKEHIANQWDKNADVTVFLVGKWLRSGGTFHSDLQSTIAIDDKPAIPVTKGNNPFIVTLAHELVHFVVAKRGRDRHGHVNENYVLLNKLIESTVIGTELFDWLFPRGTYK